MKQSLQLRLGQQITMTPQLQQAIKLLQLSTLDLQLEIQQVLDSNIMLEEVIDEDFDAEMEALKEFDGAENTANYEENISPTHQDSHEDYEVELPETAEEIRLESMTDIPEDLSVDSSWDDIYEGLPNHSDYPNGDSSGKDIFNQNNSEETLREHLLWQLELTPFSDTDRAIAHAIVHALDDDGYLHIPLEDIIHSVDADVELDEVEAVLHRLQHFDPIGIAARSLSECLSLQLSALPEETPWLTEAKHLAKDYLEILGAHDYVQLSKRMKLSREELQPIVALIQSLNPRPGGQLGNHQATYVVPDVFVRKVKGVWRVELNAEIAPKLRINSYYASLVSRCKTREETSSLKNHLQEARWFIKSLQSRHETLLKVAKCIVDKQSEFLEYGDEAMKPLVLHDIASELEMHESTISRVTTQKYLHTPRGIFELKYFFSSHVSTNNGGECSSTAIRALIKKLIASESSAKPLSDSKIADILSNRGINVARRTVAKYREAMVIPPSNERKRLA